MVETDGLKIGLELLRGFVTPVLAFAVLRRVYSLEDEVGNIQKKNAEVERQVLQAEVAVGQKSEGWAGRDQLKPSMLAVVGFREMNLR